MLDNKLLCIYQSGFVPGCSTVHQLIEIYHKICISLDKKEFFCSFFCDISKAFDRVWHKGLIEKLKSYGLSESLVKWFQDYISNRKQIVFINNSESRIGLLKAGVPHGSVLGPLLFLIYINDISDHLSSLVSLFADDTSLSYSSTNLLQIEGKLNSDINILNTWAETWLVKFNPQKTEFVIFSNKKNIDQVNILFNGENIKQVEYHTHLGVCLSLTDSVKSLPTFSKFKKAIQPVQILVGSFYNIGDRKTNIIHTKLRHR